MNTQYLHKGFCNKHNLIWGMRKKFIIDYNAFLKALYYHWKFNTKVFNLKQDHVQLSAVLLYLIYTEVRFDAVVKSSS